MNLASLPMRGVIMLDAMIVFMSSITVVMLIVIFIVYFIIKREDKKSLKKQEENKLKRFMIKYNDYARKRDKSANWSD